MAREQSGDQTEKPTPKRLKDARKEGSVAKSRELGGTVTLLCWLVVAWLAVPLVRGQLQELFQRLIDSIGIAGQVGPRGLDSLYALGWQACKTLLVVCLPVLVGVSLVGLLTEFLQVGGLFTLKRIVPKGEHLNPAEGMKRMFSQGNLVEVVKSLLKTAALVAIFVLVLARVMPEIMRLPLGSPDDVGAAHWHALMWLGIWTICVFALLSVLDALYQRYA